MAGLEIVALVPAMVSAFAACAVEYRDWRSRRKARMERRRNAELLESLEGSGPVLQAEYDNDVRRLGRVFARGDDIGRTAVMEQLVILQNNVITLLTHSVTKGNHSIHPQHHAIWRDSTSVRDNTLTALVQQYQRMSQSRPIRPALRAPGTRNCRGIIKKESRTFSPDRHVCELCGWATSQDVGVGYFYRTMGSGPGPSGLLDAIFNNEDEWTGETRGLTRDGKTMPWFSFAGRFHFWNGEGKAWKKNQWSCDYCDHRPVFSSLKGIIEHIKYFHDLEDIS